MNLIQFLDDGSERRLGVAQDDGMVVPLSGFTTSYALCWAAACGDRPLAELITIDPGAAPIAIAQLVAGDRLLGAIDHPDPHRLWITGTGFSHVREELQAQERVRLAEKGANATEGERLKLQQIEGGRSAGGRPGAQNEWFLKGNGSSLVRPGGILEAPAHCAGYSEESEIAGVYLIDSQGNPVRLGIVLGNEFADCETEKANAYYLAHSKLMPCAIGAELRLGSLPSRLVGHTRILRDGLPITQYDFYTGGANMILDLPTIEYHHFKHRVFRNPGDLHVHFFGTGARPGRYLGPAYRPGDVTEIAAPGFHVPLVTILAEAEPTAPASARALS